MTALGEDVADAISQPLHGGTGSLGFEEQGLQTPQAARGFKHSRPVAVEVSGHRVAGLEVWADAQLICDALGLELIKRPQGFGVGLAKAARPQLRLLEVPVEMMELVSQESLRHDPLQLQDVGSFYPPIPTHWEQLGSNLNPAASTGQAMALGPTGLPVVTWFEAKGGYVSRWDAAKGWGSLTASPMTGNFVARSLRISVGPSGTIVVGFDDQRTLIHTLHVLRYNR